MQECLNTPGELCANCSQVCTGAFCTACGRQMNPALGKLVCRAAQGSAEQAWKSFGFASARTSSKRARAAIGSNSAKHAASQALTAASRSIEKTVASPTPEQAHVMGVESVVEGVEWNLSTEQLQVLALARSGALRGRRKVFSRAPPKSPPRASEATAAAQTATVKRRLPKEKARSEGRATRGALRSHTRTGRHAIGVGRPRADNARLQASVAGRDSEESDSDHMPTTQKQQQQQQQQQPSACSVSVNEIGNPPSTNKTLQGAASLSTLHRKRSKAQEREETREQLVAMARGGVRYAGKVFHRKGVKLTEDSPRSMLPREAFRASGPHLLRRKYVSIGQDEHQRFFVAELSAIVRVGSLDTAGCAEGARVAPGRGNTPSLDFQRSLDRPQAVSGAHLAEVTYVCDRLRLEIRPPQLQCRQDLHRETTTIALETTSRSDRTTEDPANRCEGISSPVDAATAKKGFTLTSIEARSGSGSALEESEQRVHVPQAPPPLPDIASGRSHLDPGFTAASTDGRCYHQRPAAPVVFAQDLTHSEVDALVGSNLAWKDPFKEGSDTVRDLEATSWAACLDSLCRRLRATAKAVDAGGEGTLDGRPPGAGKQGFASDNTAKSTGVDPLVGPSGPSDDPSAAREEPSGQRCLREELPVDTVIGGQGFPAPSTAKKMLSAVSPWDGETASLDESQNKQAAQALPLLRRTPAGLKTGEDVFWLDKTILKVGARVPWGRLHRGRFAKVLFTVSLGKGCRGLDFIATSNSPTADPMLRGCWECQATDRDLARYLSPGQCGTVAGGSHRRVRPNSYDPQRCAAELHERGELVWACAEIAQKAFRLVMVVPGGVVLSLAGAATAGGREVAWPQDVEEDRVLIKASIQLQRSWRGCISRKRTRWLRMEREGMRRLSRLREQAVVEKKKAEEAKEKLLLDEERRNRAQVVLATATRVRAARKEASRRRAEQAARQCQLDGDVAAEREEAANSIPPRQNELPATAADDVVVSGRVPSEDREVGISATDTAPGLARLETVVTIDGTEVHLTAHVKEVVDGDDASGSGGGGEDNNKPIEMLLVAVDKKSRRSSKLSLKAPDITEIVASHHGGGGGGGGAKRTTGVQGALRAVVKKLTVFNSRRKDLFILSYKGKKVTAPH